MYKLLNTAIFPLLIIFLISKPVQAQVMSNDKFILHTEGIDQSSRFIPDQEFILGESTQASDNQALEGVNFKTNYGFGNSNPTNPFTVSFSANLIDFGKLNPTNPIIRSLEIGIKGNPTHGYSLIAKENNSLQEDKVFIPDTTCNNGLCTPEIAEEWTNTLAYGFGYRCDNLSGSDCDKSFAPKNYYKSFANSTQDHNPQPILMGVGSEEIAAKLSFKVNISTNMPNNNYSNVITFIAIPNF